MTMHGRVPTLDRANVVVFEDGLNLLAVFD